MCQQTIAMDVFLKPSQFLIKARTYFHRKYSDISVSKNAIKNVEMTNFEFALIGFWCGFEYSVNVQACAF